MVSKGARPWGRGRSGDCDTRGFAKRGLCRHNFMGMCIGSWGGGKRHTLNVSECPSRFCLEEHRERERERRKAMTTTNLHRFHFIDSWSQNPLEATPPFQGTRSGEKLKGRLLKGSFDKHVHIDLPVPLPVPTPPSPSPSPFASFSTGKPPPTTHLTRPQTPPPGTPIGTHSPFRKLPPAKLLLSFCPTDFLAGKSCAKFDDFFGPTR